MARRCSFGLSLGICAAALACGVSEAQSNRRHAIALSLIRQGQPDAAISALQTAVQLAPELATYAYALVLALRERGDDSDATAALAAARARHPHDQALRSLEHW